MTATLSRAESGPAPLRFGSLTQLAQSIWYDRSVRVQILLAFGAATIVASVIAGVIVVFDARSRTSVEMTAPVELAESFVRETTREIATPAEALQLTATLSAQLRHLRHVRIEITDASGTTSRVHQDSEATEDRSPPVPAWFIDLVQPPSEVRLVPIMIGPAQAASVRIEGEPADEIAEVWRDFKTMTVLWLGSNFLLLAALYVVLGRILDPLVGLGEGMRGLEHGNFGIRVTPPKVRELGLLANQFNHLAGALDTAHAEITRLCRDLISVQEEERRQIARDLHDEVGPCLFGIMVNAASIEKHAGAIEGANREAIGVSIQEIRGISERLKSLNRSLLEQLRPVALGRVTLEELIRQFVRGLERRYPDTEFRFDAFDLARSYGEGVDLTLYRCIQESTTNALRHAKASAIRIELGHALAAPASADRPEYDVCLRVHDDGTGIAPTTPLGFGIASMRERVRTHNGTFSIGEGWPSGTTVTIRIPASIDGDGMKRAADILESKGK